MNVNKSYDLLSHYTEPSDPLETSHSTPSYYSLSHLIYLYINVSRSFQYTVYIKRTHHATSNRYNLIYRFTAIQSKYLLTRLKLYMSYTISLSTLFICSYLCTLLFIFVTYSLTSTHLSLRFILTTPMYTLHYSPYPMLHQMISHAHSIYYIPVQNGISGIPNK